jgi:hypothetical protein
MPSPEASRRNLEHARNLGRVIYWRSWYESQRVKGDIAWLCHTRRDLSQRAVARMLHVSQPYVARVSKRLRLSASIEDALGTEGYCHYRDRMEAERRAHYAAQGAPQSLIGESPRESRSLFEEPPSVAATKSEPPGTVYVELLRTTAGEVVEGYGARPSWAPVASSPAYTPQVRLSARERAELLACGAIADQCPSFGRR